MKVYPLIALLGLALFNGCGSQNTDASSGNGPRNFDVPETLPGAYINTTYLEVLKKNKSTKASQEQTALSHVIIAREEDRVVLSTFWNFHEGGGAHTVKMTSETKGQTAEEEPGARVYRFDILDGQTISISDTSQQYLLTRCGDQPRIPDCDRLINEALITGKYDLDGKKVSFNSDGTVQGIPGLETYRFHLDYYDAGMEFDQVYLGFSGQGEPQVFGYEITPDHVDIFELKCEERNPSDPSFCVKHSRGPSRYWLTKK